MDKNIEELKKAALEALGGECTVKMISSDLFHVSTIDGDGIADCDNQQQAEFIASASPTTILDLIAQLEAAQNELSAANEKLSKPVVLPQRYECEGYHIGEAYLKPNPDGDCFDRDEVIDAIKEAGFTAWDE